MSDDYRVWLEDLPPAVRGFVYTDENGEPCIVLNSRLTREQNLRTYAHELGHIQRGEMFDESYSEYGGKAE